MLQQKHTKLGCESMQLGNYIIMYLRSPLCNLWCNNVTLLVGDNGSEEHVHLL